VHRFNWMQGSISVISSQKLENPLKFGFFSKIVTLRICRILYRIRPSCFFDDRHEQVNR